jgi:hypothetical protein
MPRYPLDRRERLQPAASRDVLESVRNPYFDTYKHGPCWNHRPYSGVFTGKECRFVFDGCEIRYKFNDLHLLSWFLPGVGGGWQEEYYECYESTAENLYFLFHEKKDDIPPGARAFAIDLDNNKVTMLYCSIGTEDYTNQDCDITPYFGYADWYDGAEPPKDWHFYTTELVRKAIFWRINTWILIHYYTSKQYFANQVMIGQDGLFATEPARHVKLRDGVYFFHWREMTGPGGMGADIMDLNKMARTGIFYGGGGGFKVANGFQAENGKFLTREDLIKFEHTFEERGETAAMEAMGVDLSEKTLDILYL